jgi:peptide/nickel transport system substrate-binding protein
VSSAAERPTGVVTFLFTDIEGSTRLLRELRDEYATALADHQRIIRAALADHDGSEIDTQGDSFFAAFRRAKDALGAAVDAQRALAEHEWPGGKELRVRMGIHTGEPAVGGERYVGMGVHRAARIAAAGHGGQVLVSATTRELLRDDPPPDVSLRDLGEHQLKDMDEPERIYQLGAPGLESDFPALKTSAPALAAGREGALVEAAQDTVAEMRRPWRQDRRVLGGLAGAVLVALAVVLAVVLTRGSASASSQIAANSVGFIDTKDRVKKEITVGHAPAAVASGDAIWVTNADENSVSRIDPATNTVRDTISVGDAPSGVAVGGGAVWVANGFDGTLSRISPDTDNVVQTIHVGNGPAGVAYGAGAVWVTNAVDGTVSKVDPISGRVTRTIPVATGVSAIAYGMNDVWVASPPTGSVLEVDPKSGAVVDRIGVGVDPDAVAVGAGAVWVANRSDGTLSRIDPRARAVTDTIAVGENPVAVAAGPTSVWVTNSSSGTISKVDPVHVRVVKTIRVENAPRGVVVTPRGAYVAVRSTGLSHRGGTLRVATWLAPDFLDPAISYTQTGWSVLSMTNDGLVGFRRVGGIAGITLVPDLAATLPAPADGGRTWTFRLRPGIRYSNGRLVQPEDFRRAIERDFQFTKPHSPAVQYFENIVGAAECTPRHCDLSRGIATDRISRTVTFRLTAPDADFLSKLALTFAYPVPGSTPARDQTKQRVPATGPYMIASATPRSVKLIRNPQFREWSTDAQPDGYPDTITWAFAKASPATIRAVTSGRADAALLLGPRLSKGALANLLTRYPSQVRTNVQSLTAFFFLNTRVPPFDDVRARLAVNYALDRTAFAQYLGGVAATCQILPPNYPGFRRTCPYALSAAARVDRARRLVRASGTFGQKVLVWAPADQSGQARFMTSVLRSIGYEAQPHLLPASFQYFTRILDTRSRAQIGFNAWQADFPSESGFLGALFKCSDFAPGRPDRTADPSFFCDRSVDRLMDRAVQVGVVNPPAGHTLWQEAERKVLAEAPVVPTFNRENIDFIAKHVGNYQYNPQWGALVDQLWVR